MATVPKEDPPKGGSVACSPTSSMWTADVPDRAVWLKELMEDQ